MQRLQASEQSLSCCQWTGYGLLMLVLSFVSAPVVGQPIPPSGEPAGLPERHTSRAVPIYAPMGTCVSVEEASMDPGAPVINPPCQEPVGAGQLWRFRHLGSGWYQIVAEHSGLCLTVASGSMDPGAGIEQQPCRIFNNDDQLWAVDDAFAGGPTFEVYYNILVRHSGQCLFSSGPDLPLRQEDCGSGLAPVVWFFFDDGDQYFLPSDTRLFLNDGRFRATVEWKDYEGETGVGSVVPFGAADSGMFWFFEPTNWELLIKVLDGCEFNDRYWVYFAATTDVEFTLTVTDTQTGEIWQYDNALGHPADTVTDTSAFATCP